MTDLWTYFARFSAELAVALSGMAYDPVAWFSFIALLLSGGLGTFSLGWWWQKLSGLLLVVLYITLQRRYTGTAGVPTWGSHLAFVLICLVGFAVGREIGRRLAEWSGVNKGGDHLGMSRLVSTMARHQLLERSTHQVRGRLFMARP